MQRNFASLARQSSGTPGPNLAAKAPVTWGSPLLEPVARHHCLAFLQFDFCHWLEGMRCPLFFELGLNELPSTWKSAFSQESGNAILINNVTRAGQSSLLHGK